jgi:hypothetical protein
MAKLEHLDETHQEAANRIGTRQWNMVLWVQQNHKIKTFFMGVIVLWFPKGKKTTLESSKNDGLVCIKYNFVSPIILYYSSTLRSLNQIPFW